MPTFEEYQQELQGQMSPGGDANLSRSAEQMARAAQDMSTNATMEQQQTQQILQAISQQQEQISSLTSAVRQQSMMESGPPVEMGGGPPISNRGGSPVLQGTTPMAAPPVDNEVIQGADTGPTPTPAWKKGINEVGDTAAFAGQMAGQKALSTGKQWAGETKQTAGNVWHHSRAHKQMYSGGHLGGLETDAGMIGSAYYATGMGYDPTQSKRYTSAAYKRALAESGGEKAGNLAMGGAMMGLEQATFANAGAMAGIALASRVPLLGQMFLAPAAASVGSKIGGVLDKANPISWGMGEAQRGLALASGANDQSARFLRGRSGGRSGNRFSIGERGEIAKGVREMTLDDMTFQTQEIVDLQKEMQNSGQFLGVQNGQQYNQRFKRAFDNAKAIMKSFHTSASEASDMMATMYNDIGFNHGAEMAGFSQQMYAGSYLSGLSHDKMMGIAKQGARGAASQGMMSTTGARVATGAQMVSAQAASHTMPTDLLATVGGESGLQSMIQQSTMQYLKGIGGTQLAASGFQKDPISGFSDLSNKFQSGEDILEFQTNRHRHIQEAEERLGQQGIMGQELMKYNEMAKRIAPDMDRETVMKSLMGGGPQAEAKLKSMKSLPETMRRKIEAQARQRADMRADNQWERYGPKGAIKTFYRDTIGAAGGNAVADGLIDLKTSAGVAGQNLYQNFNDYVSGVERTHFSPEEIKDIEVPENLGNSGSAAAAGASPSQIDLMTSGDGAQAAQYREIIDDAAEVYSEGELMDLGSHSGPLGSRTMLGAGGVALDTITNISSLGMKKNPTQYTDAADKKWQGIANRKLRHAAVVGHRIKEGVIGKDRLDPEDIDKQFKEMSQDEIKAGIRGVHDKAREMGSGTKQGREAMLKRFGADGGQTKTFASQEDVTKSFSDLTGVSQGGWLSHRDVDISRVAKSKEFKTLHKSMREMFEVAKNADKGKEHSTVNKSAAAAKFRAAYDALSKKGGAVKEVLNEVMDNSAIDYNPESGVIKGYTGAKSVEEDLERLRKDAAHYTIGEEGGKHIDKDRYRTAKRRWGLVMSEGEDFYKKRGSYKKVGAFKAAYNEGASNIERELGLSAGSMKLRGDDREIRTQGSDAMLKSLLHDKEAITSLRESGDKEKKMLGQVIHDASNQTGAFKRLSGDELNEKYLDYARYWIQKEGAPKAMSARTKGGNTGIIGENSTENMQAVNWEQIQVLQEVKGVLKEMRE